MTYYKTCPNCGAHLDPGERCDCLTEAARIAEAAMQKDVRAAIKKAAPGAANTGDGKDEYATNTFAPIVQGGKGSCQAENDPRQRFPNLSMTEEEAHAIMRVEQSSGIMLETENRCARALVILRADDEELEEITQYMEAKWGIKIED